MKVVDDYHLVDPAGKDSADRCLTGERQENMPDIWATKPFLSALYIAVLWLQPHLPSTNFNILLAGLTSRNQGRNGCC
jgi:hypothetical protein